MAKKTVQTARFGDVAVEQERIIQFVEPILGFSDTCRYVILDHAEDSPFKWLQSVEDPELAFVVTNPKMFGIEYEFALSDETAERLALSNAEDALVMTIVNIPQEDPSKMTTNLLGPIVVNQANCQALQVVLHESGYNTKTRLIPDDILEQQSKGASTQPSPASAEKGE